MYFKISVIAIFFLGHLSTVCCFQQIYRSTTRSSISSNHARTVVTHAGPLIKILQCTKRDDLQKSKLKSNTFVGLLQVLPIVSLILSAAGISFQVFVLYPWHEELSKPVRFKFRTYVFITIIQ